MSASVVVGGSEVDLESLVQVGGLRQLLTAIATQLDSQQQRKVVRGAGQLGEHAGRGGPVGGRHDGRDGKIGLGHLDGALVDRQRLSELRSVDGPVEPSCGVHRGAKRHAAR